MDMNRLKDWAIKRLGGYTKDDVRELRSMCKSMAEEFGKGLSPMVVGDATQVRDLSVVGSLYIIGDYVSVTGCMFWVGDNATAISIDGCGEGRVLSHNVITGGDGP